MKKKRESGKGMSNSAGVDVYHRGESDSYNNSGNHSGEYAGHLKRCYQNGYMEGQRRRAFEKRRSKT
jgi:hypothetical protein